MSTTIIRYHRHMRWPLVAPGRPLFVISDRPAVLEIVRWAFRKKQTGYVHDIQRACIDGQVGVLVEAYSADETKQTTRPVKRLGEALFDWGAIEPGTSWQRLTPDMDAANALVRSANHWTKKTGITLVAQRFLRPNGILVVAYRPRSSFESHASHAPPASPVG